MIIKKHKKMRKIVINKNCHYTWSILPSFFFVRSNKVQAIEKDIMFTDSCLYEDINSQINKLFGFSFGLLSSPRKESYRFGWNCERKNGKIQVYNYREANERFLYDYICDIEINKHYSYRLTKTKNLVIMEIFDKDYLVVKFENILLWDKKCGFIKTARPYFGGDLFAPHKMIFWFK